MMAPNTIITLRNSEYRPCMVDGRKALFHRFEEEDQVLLQFGSSMPMDMEETYIRRAVEQYKTYRVLSADVKSKIIKSTLALVEFEDGTVEKVDPKSIRFLDSENLFLDAFNKNISKGDQ